MRRFALALASLFIFAGVAQASPSTVSVTGSAGHNAVWVAFTITADGPASAVATFAAKKAASYSLRIEDYHLCGGVICILPGDQVWCYTYAYASPLECDADLPAGSYRAIFVNYGNPAVNVTLSVTGELAP